MSVLHRARESEKETCATGAGPGLGSGFHALYIVSPSSNLGKLTAVRPRARAWSSLRR